MNSDLSLSLTGLSAKFFAARRGGDFGGNTARSVRLAALITLAALTASGARVDASGALGQTDINGNALFNVGAANNLVSTSGYASPRGLAIDSANHRLFLADTVNNRVLVIPLSATNQITGRNASHVLGQPSIRTNAGAATISGLNGPNGLAYDAPHHLLWVADTNNNRVLGFNTNPSTIATGENASYVLGQPNFTTVSAGTTQAKLSGPYGLAYDAVHSVLLAGDTQNSRVLGFNAGSVANGQNAAFVLGQGSFTTATSAVSATGLGRPSGIVFDAGDNLIFVLDALNNRVMAYPGVPAATGQAATFVLGQPDFSSSLAATNDSSLRTNSGSNYGHLAYDEGSHSLFVADVGSRRVLVWSGLSSSTASASPAAYVYGQSTFNAAGIISGSAPAAAITQPFGLAYDAVSQQLFTADNALRRVLTFAYPPVTAPADATGLLGHALYTVASTNDSPNATGLSGPSAATLDPSGHRLFVSDQSNRRILVFPLDNSNLIASQTATHVIGRPDTYTAAADSGCSRSGLGLVAGSVYDAINSRLFAADFANNRVMVYTNVGAGNLVSTPQAAFVIGQPDFVTCTTGTTRAGLNKPAGLAYDPVSSRLFVSDNSNNRVMVYDVRPTNLSAVNPGFGSALNASFVIAQPDFTTATSRLTASGLKNPGGVAYDPNSGNLFVADKLQHRVLVFNASAGNLQTRQPGFGTSLDASYCVGQGDFQTSIPRATQWGFNAPDDLSFDPTMNRLAVSDTANNRVLFFDASPLALASVNPGFGGMFNAYGNLGQSDWTSSAASTSQNGYTAPNIGNSWDPALNVAYIREGQNNRVMQVQMVHITAVLPNGSAGAPYTNRITTTGSQGTLSFSIVSGALPNGLSLDPQTGIISGTPAPTSQITFTVEARDNFGNGGYFYDRATYALSFAYTGVPQRVVTPSSVSNDGAAYSATPIAVAYPAANTAGNFLWLSFIGDNNAGGVTTVTDSRGNLWNRAVGAAGTTQGRVEIWYAQNARQGSNSVAVTFSGGGSAQVFIHEFTNVALASALDSSAYSSSSGISYSSGTAVTTGFNDLIVGAVQAGTSSLLAAGGGFTRLGSSVTGVISRADEAGAFSPGNNAATFSSAVSTTKVIVMAAFRPADQDYTVTGVAAGAVGIPSAPMTWRKGTGLFNNCTLFVSDGGRGGIWGGSISGTSTGSFFANGISAFNATYTPAVSGPITFTYTNNCLLNDPPTGLFSQPGFSFSGCPAAGTKNVASAPCVVSLAGASSSTVTIVDGGNKGIVTPALGAACATPCTISLSGGTAVFTYKPVVIGTIPLSTTNVAGLINAIPVNDVVTGPSQVYIAAASGNWNSPATWTPAGVPSSGDTWLIPAPYTVHVPQGYTAISGSCPVSSNFADGTINSGAALIVDSGATFRMQGNIRLNSPLNGGSNGPILQYSTGSVVTPDQCNRSVIYGPFAASSESYNLFSVGVDTSIVTTSGVTVTRTSGADFNATGAWNGKTMTISGVAYTVASCSSTSLCTLTSGAGSRTGAVSLVTQAGALTWPPPTSVTAMNNSLVNPVLFFGNGNYNYLSATIYGAEINSCGTSSRACLPGFLSNYTHNLLMLNRSDMQNFIMNRTGGETSEGVTTAESSWYVRRNGQYRNSLGTVSMDPNMAGGDAVGGSYCAIENIFSDVPVGDISHGHFSRCNISGVYFAADMKSFGQITPTNQWARFDNAVVIRPSCGEFMYWGGSASNFLLNCPQPTVSLHVSAADSPNVPLVFEGGICQRDSSYSEGHFLFLSAGVASVTIRNNLLLPSTSDGSLCSTLATGINASTTSRALSPRTMTGNTMVGRPSLASGSWTGHPGTAFPSAPWLISMQGNIFYQSTPADRNDSFPLSTPFNSSTAPANQVDASAVDYNVLWNQYTSSQFAGALNSSCAPSTSSGTPYDICTTTGVPGVHDTVADPRFVDPTRNLYTWASTQGQAASLTGAAAVFIAAPPSTYPALLSNMFGYIRGGFVATNPVLRGAGPGGADIVGCCTAATGSAALPTVSDPALAVSQVVAGISQPTGMVFLGANDFLIAERTTGRVKRVDNGTVTATVLDLPVNSYQERGLLGMALDRNFPATPNVYLYWTESSTTSDTNTAAAVGNSSSPFPPGAAAPMGNRVDRFIWNSTLQTLTYSGNIATLRALQSDQNNPVNNSVTPQGNHNGGKLVHGPDGKLYIMVGDIGRRGWMQNLFNGPAANGSADDTYGGPSPGNPHLSGVVLRMNTDGSVPVDNPFFGAGSGIGGVAGANIQKVFSYGHRDSFGMALDPASGYLWLSEKGDDSFDEINRLQAGGNYGWAQAMGPVSRLAQFKAIETNMLTSSTDLLGSLEQLRFPVSRIAYSGAAAQAAMFTLPGATYRDPELSWRYSMLPSGLGFLTGNGLGANYAGTLWSGQGNTKSITGGATGTFTGGTLMMMRLTPDRQRLDLSADSRLADKVADNGVAYPPVFGTLNTADGFRFDGRESESLMIGQGFGAVTDIQTGPDGVLYVVSGSSGAVYRIRLAP